MENKFYTPMEQVLIEGANRLQHNNNLLLLLDYEMEQLISGLEAQVQEQEQGAQEIIL